MISTMLGNKEPKAENQTTTGTVKETQLALSLTLLWYVYLQYSGQFLGTGHMAVFGLLSPGNVLTPCAGINCTVS